MNIQYKKVILQAKQFLAIANQLRKCKVYVKKLEKANKFLNNQIRVTNKFNKGSLNGKINYQTNTKDI